MPDDVMIRAATDSDVDAIQALENEAFPVPWRREFFESELEASGRLNFVAVRSRTVVGYVFAMWVFDEMHVNKIAVRPAQRRRGIARTLMDHVLQFARAHEVGVISLEVRESNMGAQDFYRTLAFSPSYVRPRYYPDGEAAVVMTRKV